MPSAVISPWLTRGYVRRNLGTWASPSVKLQNGVLGRSHRIDARIGRNSNGFFILDNDGDVIEFGFLRIILAILPPRAHPIAVWLFRPIRQSV